MKRVLLLGLFVLFAWAMQSTSAAAEESTDNTLRCQCERTGGYYTLWYIDHDGKRHVIYTYDTVGECYQGLKATPLCYSNDKGQANSYCDQVARYCWMSCDKRPLSCYYQCMWERGCNP